MIDVLHQIKNKINKAIKNGIECKVLDSSNDIDLFYNLYESRIHELTDNKNYFYDKCFLKN